MISSHPSGAGQSIHPRVLAFAGPSNSGKTTLICRLLPWLCRRGLKVAVLKHSHKLNLADADKDTGRLRAAGAEVVALAGPQMLQITRTYRKEPPLNEVLAHLAGEADLVLVEGYKSSPLPKVAVLGPGPAPPLTYPGLVAVVGVNSPPELNLPHFHPDQVEELGRFLLEYLKLTDVPPNP